MQPCIVEGVTMVTQHFCPSYDKYCVCMYHHNYYNVMINNNYYDCSFCVVFMCAR